MLFTYRDLGYNGRLGNQLWQMASTIGIAEKNGGTAVFDPDWAYRKYFNVPDRYFGEVPFEAKEAWEWAKGIHHAHRPYMQDLSLWADIAWDIFEWFQPSSLARQTTGIIYDRTTAVHVRRTDAVVKQHLFRVPSVAYFTTAMSALVPVSNVFLVFSDDMDWCMREMPASVGGIPLQFMTPMLPEPSRNHKGDPLGNQWEMNDFFMMMKCDNHIISNSTFSWWAAWLSKSTSPVAPKQWFNGRYVKEINLDHFLPSTWRRM